MGNSRKKQFTGFQLHTDPSGMKHSRAMLLGPALDRNHPRPSPLARQPLGRHLSQMSVLMSPHRVLTPFTNFNRRSLPELFHSIPRYWTVPDYKLNVITGMHAQGNGMCVVWYHPGLQTATAGLCG